MQRILTILIVEDNDNFRFVIESFLSDRNDVLSASTLEAAKISLGLKRFDLVLLDLNLPDGDGISLVPDIKDSHPDAAVWIMSSNTDVAIAVDAMKRGVDNYLIKPVQLEELDQQIIKLKQSLIIRDELLTLRSKVEQYQTTKLMVKSANMVDVVKSARHFAHAERTTVLICGETGTGKELIAEEIHTNSPRKNGPFIKINCAAIPENLIESELFGYEKGAFTDARATRNGLFEKAHSGTLFLDEIGELPLVLQPKLLRALEAKAIRRLGGHNELPVDVRVIAATNRNLKTQVEENTFRADLYHRLNVLEIEIPPLRKRSEDVLFLTHYFVAQFSRDFKMKTELTADAETVLLAYNWPGNVRELRNVIERAVILSNGEPISKKHLSSVLTIAPLNKPNQIIPEPADDQSLVSLEEMSKMYMKKVLDYCGGNKTAAAKILGVSRNTIRENLGE